MLEFAADTCKMCFGVTCSRGKREVWTADPACEVARRRPVVYPHGIERQILHGEIASFDVDEEHARRIKRPQQSCLAHASRPHDKRLDAAPRQAVRLRR